MDALDLSRQPPRGPRVLLGDLDLLMIARTIDKLRATLPGGNLGSYKIDGFSSRLLDALGITQEELRDAIARASSEDEIAAWIGENSDPSRYESINLSIEDRKIQNYLDDPKFLERYPIAKTLPPDTPAIDMLVTDDDHHFAQKPPA